MAAAGPLDRVASTGDAMDSNFFTKASKARLSIANPNAPGGYYDINIVYDGYNRIYINNNAILDK